MAMDEFAHSILNRQRQLETIRTEWETHWEEVRRQVWPRNPDFVADRFYETKGEKKMEFVYDATAVLALERFSAIMEQMLTPRTQKWHLLRASNRDLNKIPEVAEWFDNVNRVLFDARYSPKANFASNMNQVYMALGSFGTGAMFIDDAIGLGLRYKNVPLNDLYISENSEGIVDTVYRKIFLTARQAIQMFEDKTIPGNKGVPETIKLKAETDPEHEFKFIHSVQPRKDVKVDKKNFEGMAFASVYVSDEGQMVVREGGFNKFPYGIARYVLIAGDIYGRSPAMTALPDIKTLNEMEKTTLKAAHKAVDPPLLAYDDGVVSELSLKPGAINFGGVSKDGRQLIQPLNSGVNLPIGEDQKEKKRKLINDAFLVTLFQILVENPRMTATEVLERSQEKGALLSPAMGRQQSEFLGPMIERELDILLRANALPPMPDVLVEAEGEFSVEYDSPLSKAQRAEEVSGIIRTMETISPFAQIDPAVMDIFNVDEIARITAEVNGVPFSAMKSEQVIEEERAARAEQQQQQQAVQAAEPVAGAVKDMAEVQELLK